MTSCLGLSLIHLCNADKSCPLKANKHCFSKPPSHRSHMNLASWTEYQPKHWSHPSAKNKLRQPKEYSSNTEDANFGAIQNTWWIFSEAEKRDPLTQCCYPTRTTDNLLLRSHTVQLLCSHHHLYKKYTEGVRAWPGSVSVHRLTSAVVTCKEVQQGQSW